MERTMNDAVVVNITGPRAFKGDDLPPGAGATLFLFEAWCNCLKFHAPADWPESRKEDAYAANGDLHADIMHKIFALDMADGLTTAAALWVAVHKDALIDRQNPCLPMADDDERRDLVLRLAAQWPALARAAGVAPELMQ
jgi:hypothetical protein